MSKSHKHKGPAPVQAADSLEQQAREHLAGGRFRKARDLFKELCKLDRGKYLPGLIEANAGLAKEMIAKGQVSEAQQVLAYLRTIAPPAQLQAIEFELGHKGDNWDQVAAAGLQVLTEAAAAASPAAKIRAADVLVAGFRQLPEQTPPQAEIAGQVKAVQAALQAISESQWEQALDLARPIPTSSPFAHWKLWIKGLAAFHTGAKEKAARLLAELPADSFLVQARRPYLLLCDGENPSGPHEPPSPVLLNAACRLAGQPACGALLVKAEQLWRAKKYTQAYQVCREALADFPSDRPDLVGALTDFFFKISFKLRVEEAERYTRYFGDQELDEHFKSPREKMLILHLLAHALERLVDAQELRRLWTAFLAERERLHGPNPRLDSLAYGRLGKVLAEPAAPSPFFGGGGFTLFDAEGAVEALRKSIELDPANLDAHLELTRVYKELKRTSERNRLLDTMTSRFPDRKEVLLQAARGCLERKAFVKGLEYVDRALQFDRLDPAIPDLLAEGCVRLAQQYYEKGRLEQARATLARVEPYLVEAPDSWQRGRWGHYARTGVLEKLFGDMVTGDEWLERARTDSPDPAVFALYAHLAWRAFAPGQPASSPLAGELDLALHRAPSARHARLLIELWHFWKEHPDLSLLPGEETLLRTYLRAAAKQPFSREEARALLDATKWVPQLQVEVQPFIDQMLRQDPQDPLFRLYRFLTVPPAPGADVNVARVELEAIIAEAQRRRDDKTVEFAKGILAGFKNLGAPPPLYDEEADDFDDAEDREYAPDPFGPIPVDEAQAVSEIMAMLGSAGPAELRELRKLLGKKFPPGMLDILIDAARKGTLPPMPPPPPVFKSSPAPRAAKPKPEAKPAVRQPDPNQPELF